MAGSIALPDGTLWSASSWVFYWVIDTLADELDDPELAARVRSISEHNLGWLDPGDFSAEDRARVVAVLRSMPELAIRRMAPSEGRDAYVAVLTKLAGKLGQ